MKVLVSDYDQTFYVNEDSIIKNKEAVDKFREKNNLFIFATGRSHIDFLRKVKQYNLNYDYVILNHGATILNNKEEVLFNVPIDSEIISSIVNDLDLDNSINHFFCNLENSRCNMNDVDITKINVKYDSYEKAMEIKNYIDEKYQNYVHSYIVISGALEIVNSKINKAVAISKLVDILNLNKDDIYTIGDGYSDIEMIKEYNGYCMKDSIDILQKYCKDKQLESVTNLIKIIDRS